MKTAVELKRDLDGMQEGLDKHYDELQRIYKDIQDIERQACKDMGFSLREIQDVRKLIPIVQRKIASAVSTMRRKQEREAARNG